MTRGRTTRSSPAAAAAAEAQKSREDDLRIKNLLDDFNCLFEEKVMLKLLVLFSVGLNVICVNDELPVFRKI